MGLHRRLVWKIAKGFRGRAGNCIKLARQQAEKALQHAYRGRKEKKREARSLWIQRINAGAREHGVGGAALSRAWAAHGRISSRQQAPPAHMCATGTRTHCAPTRHAALFYVRHAQRRYNRHILTHSHTRTHTHTCVTGQVL